MSMPKTQKTMRLLLVGAACLATLPTSQAAAPIQLLGAIVGVVSDGSGVPQMGATVTLFNRQERVFQKVLTDEHGEFRFPGLFPDVYSIRVNLATFVPAFKKGVLVEPGMRSVLHVNLNGLFSSIQITYPTLQNGSFMTDDWKWVLRSASSMRPVSRFVEVVPEPISKRGKTERAAMFSQTRGILKVSAGDGPLASGIGNEADLGTAFALATSVYGNNMVQVSGNLGYGSQTGAPAAAFRTSYSRNLAGGSPEVSVTMRQLSLPGRLASALGGNESALPMLRTMSASFDDRTQIGDHATLHYGFTMDSVTFLDHLNYFSPYARLTYDVGRNGKLELTYTSGNARPDLAAEGPEADLQRDLDTLALFPRVSLRDGHAKIQRGEEYEIAYSQRVGSRVYGVSAYHEHVTNAALSMVAPPDFYSESDLLPDLFSGNATFDAGQYQSSGYTASVTQDLGDHFSATLIYGSMGALTVNQRELVSHSPDELRSMIRAGRKHSATVRIAATSPWTGTRLIASYQFAAERGWAMPGNLYSTQSIRPVPGLNIYIRQPIPRIAMLPWRMEATADLRNLLAEGYLPLQASHGQQLILVQTPRSFRGGFSFIF
jgi:hypothetical protein